MAPITRPIDRMFFMVRYSWSDLCMAIGRSCTVGPWRSMSKTFPSRLGDHHRGTRGAMRHDLSQAGTSRSGRLCLLDPLRPFPRPSLVTAFYRRAPCLLLGLRRHGLCHDFPSCRIVPAKAGPWHDTGRRRCHGRQRRQRTRLSPLRRVAMKRDWHRWHECVSHRLPDANAEVSGTSNGVRVTTHAAPCCGSDADSSRVLCVMSSAAARCRRVKNEDRHHGFPCRFLTCRGRAPRADAA